jgi:hypothetical protein
MSLHFIQMHLPHCCALLAKTTLSIQHLLFVCLCRCAV